MFYTVVLVGVFILLLTVAVIGSVQWHHLAGKIATASSILLLAALACVVFFILFFGWSTTYHY